MKRALFVMVVGLGIGMMGCAAGVEDDVVPVAAPEEQRDPPQQALTTQLRDPQSQLIDGVAVNKGFERVPAKQIPTQPPVPQPGN